MATASGARARSEHSPRFSLFHHPPSSASPLATNLPLSNERLLLFPSLLSVSYSPALPPPASSSQCFLTIASHDECEAAAAALETLWRQFFLDPSQWWDKSFDKENPDDPDFKHKTSDKALWVSHSLNPSWLQGKLATLNRCPPPQAWPLSLSPSPSPSKRKIFLGQASSVRQLWEEFFSDPSQWWDYRSDKASTRFPDFKHKTAAKALWIGSRCNPPWIHARLAAMVQCREWGQSGCPTPNDSSGVVRVKQLWEEFFADPSQWWDNRHVKKSPKYPDFKHKSTHEGLWIEDRLNYSGLKTKIAELSLELIQSGGGSNSGSYQSCGADASVGTGRSMHELCRQGRLQEALHAVELMLKQNIQIPIYAYVFLLKECGNRKALVEGRRLHASIIQNGLDSHVFLGNTLIQMYAKCGSLSDACKIFDAMLERNVFSWTAIISAHVQNGQNDEAVVLFQAMEQTGLAPDKVVLIIALKACARIGALETGKHLHSAIIRRGLESDMFLSNGLVDMYAKCGCLEKSYKVFCQMKRRDVVSWNTMMAGFVQQALGRDALALYPQMQTEGVRPDNVTFVVLLKACTDMAALEQGQQLHSHLISGGFGSDMVVVNALVDMYSKCGRIHQAREVFDKATERDVILWNTMISGYAQEQTGDEALRLYDQMKHAGVQPTKITCVLLLKACASIAALQKGKELHSLVVRLGFDTDVIVGTSLTDMYAKCGRINEAFKVFKNMPKRDVVAWNTIIAGSARQGLGKEALTLLEEMKREGMAPNEATYASVLSACSSASLVDEGRHIFNSMCDDPLVRPTVDHYACMVDLLGRSGRVADAEEFIKRMPMEPDAVIWAALLGAARNHGHVDIGGRAFNCIMELEPENDGAYVLLSNIYATSGDPEVQNENVKGKSDKV